MKIAICTHKFIPPFIGGVDVYTDRLRRALRRSGYDVVVIAFDATGDANDRAVTVRTDEEYDGSPVWRIKFAFAGRPKKAFDYAYDPEMGRAVAQILEEQRPNLVIVMNFYTITLAVVEVAKALGIVVGHVATDFIPICRRATLIRWDGRSCHIGESIKSCAACFVSHNRLGRVGASLLNRLPEKTLLQWANKQDSYPMPVLSSYWNHVKTMEKRLEILQPLRHQVDFVLAPTQYTWDMFVGNGFRPEQVHLLPFGVDVDNPLAQLEHTPASHTRFLFVGRLQPYKGAHLLVEAFNNLQSPQDATLTIYGAAADGYEVYFERLQTMMNANDRVQFAGTIPPWELASAFADADFFVLPSTWHENSPLILLDALQSRTPVIASNVGGVTDIVKDGVNGLLFPMGDKHALQRVLQRVIDEATLRQSLKPGTCLTSIEEYAERVVELYRQHVGRQRVGARMERGGT